MKKEVQDEEVNEEGVQNRGLDTHDFFSNLNEVNEEENYKLDLAAAVL